MPNIKSSKKRMIQSEKKRKENTSKRSMMKTFIKKVSHATKTKNEKVAKNAFFQVQSILDRLARKKLIHRNKAARHKSKLMIRINNIKQKIKISSPS